MGGVPNYSGDGPRSRDLLAEACAPHLQPAGDVALLGFPNHGNVGDSAIWLGQLQLLREFGLDHPVYTASAASYSRRALARRASEDTTILLSGGGNLGDLWPVEQRTREAVVRDFPGHRIIQLPQSVRFRTEAARRRAASVLGAHDHFTLMVRDEASRRRAEEQLDLDAVLAPDPAMFLGALDAQPPDGRDIDVLCLLRTDKESRSAAPTGEPAGLQRLSAAPNTRVARVDWVREPESVPVRMLSRIHPLLPRWPWPAQHRIEEYLAAERLARGLRLLGRARFVVTDRLHGHLLSLLAGVPHALLDNSYGKISAYYRTWTAESPQAELCDTVNEAVDRAAGFVSGAS